jgi:hypothetical protein
MTSSDLIPLDDRTAGAIILLISHGYTVDPRPGEDHFVKLADLATEQFSYSTEPGRWLVDIMPICKSSPNLMFNEYIAK